MATFLHLSVRVLITKAIIDLGIRLLRSWLSCVIGELFPPSRTPLQLAVSCVLVQANWQFENIPRPGIR